MSTTSIEYYQVDAFTERPFTGNPAGICLTQAHLSARLMQQVAAENNLPITSFIVREADGFSMRWFTPTAEIKLCGHGTLAAAHVLWASGMLDKEETAVFQTTGGVLTVTMNREWCQMSFPAFSVHRIPMPGGLEEALGIPVVHSLQANDGRLILEVASPDALRKMHPNFMELAVFPSIAITSVAEPGTAYDFLSRSFAPAHGVNEDQVTGSSHCALAPYWGKKLQKTTMVAFQASKRGGELRLALAGDRVLIEGKALIVKRATITL